MPRTITKRDPIKAHQRKVTAERRVGKNAKCSCRESRPEALIPSDDSVICAACKRTREGKSVMDKHHIAGRANHPATIEVPVNDHRARLSVDQYDWPKKTLENSDRSPLRFIAACLRGFIDTVRYLIDRCIVGIAELLEYLDELLIERLGPKWWLNTPLTKCLEELIRAGN